jgi:hypothetical protein
MKRIYSTVTVLAMATALSAGCAATVAEVETMDWDDLSSEDYGIRVKVPDANQCEADEAEDEGLGVLGCDYGDIQVVVMAYAGAVSMDELREAAVELSEVPGDYWEWQGETAGNGYRQAEAWSASAEGHTLIGLIGQSGEREVSHIVYIFGSDEALEAHGDDVNNFVATVYAI